MKYMHILPLLVSLATLSGSSIESPLEVDIVGNETETSGVSSKSRMQKKHDLKKFKSSAVPKLFDKLKSTVLICNSKALLFLDSFNKFGEFLAVARDNDRNKYSENYFAQFAHIFCQFLCKSRTRLPILEISRKEL